MSQSALEDRALIRVGGEEARAFLHGLLTHDVLTLAQGAPRYAGLLSPQGKVLFDFILWADGPHDVLIDCEAARADALIRRLSLYRLRRPVTIARDETWAVHWAHMAEAQPNDPRPADPRLAALGARWLAPADEGGMASAFRAHRLSLGVCEGVAELGDGETLWLETNAQELHGVDYAKGCYIGQENTARMHYRNKVGRRLIVLPLDLSDPARRRAEMPDLGLAIDLRRVEDLDGLPLPDWLCAALKADGA